MCFLAFYRTLAGNYVNFGVFELYGDPSLQNALTVTLRMALSIPLTDTLAYRKGKIEAAVLLHSRCTDQANFAHALRSV